MIIIQRKENKVNKEPFLKAHRREPSKF